MNLSSLGPSSLGLPHSPPGRTTLSTADKQSAKDVAVLEGKGTEDKRQAALQLVNKTLARAYEKIGSKNPSATADYNSFEPLTAEKVASNILGFIERRLQMDAAGGATQEQLKTRLEAGLAGFNKGFAEASEQLEALNMLSEDVASDLGKTKDLVLKGIDQLRTKFIDDQDAQPDANQSTKANSSKALALPKPVAAAAQETTTHVGYARARDFSFELKTREGDTVTIHASASEGFAYEASSAKGGKNLQGSYSASQSMSWEVNGNLSDEEVNAINDLLGNVDKLANEFFDGDLDTAFEQAKNLGYDDKQIGSFSLNLAQSEIQQVTQTYKTFEPASAENATPLLSDQLLPLGHFIRDLLESVKMAELFPEPWTTLGSAAQHITADDEQGVRLQEFIKKIGGLFATQDTTQ